MKKMICFTPNSSFYYMMVVFSSKRFHDHTYKATIIHKADSFTV